MNHEHNLTEEMLNNCKEYRRIILRAAMDGFWMLDIEGRLLEVNDAYCRMSEYSEQELLAMSVSDLSVLESREQAAAHIARIMERGQDRFETRHRRKDGSIIDLEVSAQCLSFEGGRIIAFLRDITERRQAEEALKESDSFIRSVMDNLPIGIAVNSVDPTVSFKYMNDNFPGFYRTTREALASPAGFWSAVYKDPDFREEVRKRVLDDCSSGDPDRMHWIDVPITRNGDETKYIEARNTPIPDKKLMVSTVWDVTARKQLELALLHEQELYEDLVNTLPAGAYRLRVKNRGTWQAETWRAMATTQYFLDFASDRFCAILGIARETLAANPGVVSDFIHPDDKENFDARNAQAMIDFNTFIWEGRIVSNKQTRWVHFESVPRVIDPETVLWTGIVYDITELKQTEEALRERKEQLRTIFEASLAGIILVNPQGTILFANNRMAEMLGMPLGQLISSSYSQHIHEKERQAGDNLMWQLIQGDIQSVEIERHYLRADGSDFWGLLSGKRLENPDGTLRALVGIISDITDRKQSEEALRTSRNLLHSVLENVPTRVFWKDSESRYLGCNTAFARDAGFAHPEELLSKDDFQMGWREQAELYRADDRQVMDSGTPKIGIEEPQTTPDGRMICLCTSKVPLRDAENRVVGLLGIYEDITERKLADKALRESENRLRFALEGTNDGLWDVQMKTGTTYLSPRGCEMLGYQPDEACEVATAWADLVHPDDLPLTNERLQAHLEGRTPIFEVEQRLRMKSGDWKWVLARGKVVYRDEDGVPLRMTGTHTDLSEQKKLQEQLSQAQKMEAVGRLAGGVAHDFNNMLNVILGHAELALIKEAASPALREHLEQIQKAAVRSAEIVSQLLAFARKQTITPRVLDLNESVETMLKMLRRLIGEGIELAWLPAKVLWPVRMDPSQIDQILTNLCVNARDAVSGAGKITIETANKTFDTAFCSGHKGFVPGKYVLLTVSDDGCGMNKETLSMIFEPFFTTKGLGEGTGLGLAMVYGIVKQNGGFIDVYSEPNQGTSFKIYLPRHLGKEEQSLISGPMEPIESVHETVLMVEDEPALLDLGKQLLEMQGYRVLAAATPGEAIRLAEEHIGEIRLLLTDVVMPEMNGRELAQKLLSLYPGLKSLFMSGYTADIIAHHGVLDEGMYFIQKPFSLDALMAKVRETLDH